MYIPLSPAEELRRQISCMLSIKDESRAITQDENQDVWHTLMFADKLGDQKAIGQCLEMILQHISTSRGNLEIDEGIIGKIIAMHSSTNSNKVMAEEILSRQNLQESVNNIEVNSMISSEMNSAASTGKIDQQTSTRMCLFQLSESNDIDRVTLILKTIAQKSRDTLNQMSKKYNLTHKLISVLKKYCNAEYGFDHLSSKNGTF